MVEPTPFETYNYSQIGSFPPKKKTGNQIPSPQNRDYLENPLSPPKIGIKIYQLEVCWVEGPWLVSHFNGRKSVGFRLEISYVDFSEFQRWIIQATTTLGLPRISPNTVKVRQLPSLKLNDKCHVNPKNASQRPGVGRELRYLTLRERKMLKIIDSKVPAGRGCVDSQESTLVFNNFLGETTRIHSMKLSN